jgi:hypothetical protein
LELPGVPSGQPPRAVACARTQASPNTMAATHTAATAIAAASHNLIDAPFRCQPWTTVF